MPSSWNLKQTVTWWQFGVKDAFGSITYQAPVTIQGRWEDKTILFIDTEGKEVQSEAVVYLDTKPCNGDYLYMGASGSNNPKSVAGAKEIRSIRVTPSLFNDKSEYKAML